MDIFQNFNTWQIIAAIVGSIVVILLVGKIVQHILDIRKAGIMRKRIDEDIAIRKPIIFTTYKQESDELPLIVHELYLSCTNPVEHVALACLNNMHDFKLYYEQIKNANLNDINYKLVHRVDGKEITAFFYPVEMGCTIT